MKVKKLHCSNGNVVETWYDKAGKYYVVRVTDPEGNQIGEADYSGNRLSAQWALELALKENDR
jgi:hypothetical protein